MLAFAMTWPDAPIYVWGIFPVKAMWLVAFLFAMTLISAFTGPRGAASPTWRTWAGSSRASSTSRQTGGPASGWSA